MRGVAVLAAMAILDACSMPVARFGVVTTDPDVIGIKLLRPNVRARSCRATVFAIPLARGEPSVDEAMRELEALDSETNAITNAEVAWDRIVTGVYNRTCVEIHGDLGRVISTVIVPVPGHGSHPMQ